VKAPPGGVMDRLAGAPISWGVCEVPGWGVMLPRDRVLSEMHQLGLKASELGALGYLGDDPGQIRALLSSFSLGAVGGFVPVALHDPGVRQQAQRDAEQAARLLAGAGGTYFVTAAVVDAEWSPPFELDARQWDDLAAGLSMVEEVCAAHGLIQVLHPHVGTLVERAEHVLQVLQRSDVRFCLDTGHFSIGGIDPVEFAVDHAGRVGLVHLKDVDMALAPAVRDHQTTLLEATRAGLFQALGRGSVDISGAVRALEERGYGGWYVLEQDTTIAEPTAGTGTGPVDPAADVKASIEYLEGVAAGETSPS
jgi:inosose dehydratase